MILHVRTAATSVLANTWRRSRVDGLNGITEYLHFQWVDAKERDREIETERERERDGRTSCTQ